MPKKVLLIHNLPTPYRTSLFNELSQLLDDSDIQLIVMFQTKSSQLRSLWSDEISHSKFKYVVSKSFSINALQIKIPLRPIAEISAIKPDLIVTTGFNLHSWFSYIYTFFKKIPLIVWSGEREIKGIGSPLRKLARKIILTKTAHLLTYGTASQAFLSGNFGIPKSRMTNILNVIPIHHSVDTNKTIEDKLDELSRKQIRLIFVGNLFKNKGIYAIPDLMQKIANVLHEFRIQLTIIGDGKERENLDRMLNAISINMEYRFLGKVPNEKTLNEISQNHFLLFPTLGDTWGHVITEALYVGTPVITSEKAGAVPDTISNNFNGLIANFNNPQSIATRIREIIEHHRYKEMCISSRDSYTKLFNSINNPKTFSKVIVGHLK